MLMHTLKLNDVSELEEVKIYFKDINIQSIIIPALIDVEIKDINGNIVTVNLGGNKDVENTKEEVLTYINSFGGFNNFK